MSDAPRAQLIHIDVDRRLGHEWDEWNGQPLPNAGNYDSPAGLFFRWSALTLGVALGSMALVLYLLGPRVGLLLPRLSDSLWVGLGIAAGALWIWWLLLLGSWLGGRPLLPERLAERGPLLGLMRLTSMVADRFGRRDWVENAAVKVYDSFALARGQCDGFHSIQMSNVEC